MGYINKLLGLIAAAKNRAVLCDLFLSVQGYGCKHVAAPMPSLAQAWACTYGNCFGAGQGTRWRQNLPGMRVLIRGSSPHTLFFALRRAASISLAEAGQPKSIETMTGCREKMLHAKIKTEQRHFHNMVGYKVPARLPLRMPAGL